MTKTSDFLETFDEGSRSRAPKRNPSTVVGLVALGAVLLLALGALVWFVVLKDDTKTPDDLLNDALAAHVAGDVAGASDLYNEILADDPTNKFAHYNLGLIAQTAGRSEDAERSYLQALTTDPAYGPALYNLAIIKYEAKEYAESIDLYRRLIAVEPDNAAAHLNLGYALRDNGQIEAGDREIRQAIELDPSLSSQAPPTTDTTLPAEDADATTTTTTAA